MKNHRPSAAVWLFSGFAIFVIWAAVFEIDQSVQSQGQVIPGARTQIIQVADGGVLAKLLVQEGQQVAEGETLAILERERAVAAYEESLVKLTAQKASLIRARAEIGGYEPEFGEAFAEFPEFVEQSLGHYRQRKKSLEDSTLILDQRIAITEEVEAINEKLFFEGDTSRMELLQSKRELAHSWSTDRREKANEGTMRTSRMRIWEASPNLSFAMIGRSPIHSTSRRLPLAS